jgi:hypothetical protein
MTSHSRIWGLPLLWAEATAYGFEIKIPGSTGINCMFLRFLSERDIHKERLVIE